ncbi:MAG: hypothetical protein ACLRRT_05905 [Ruthenibacterium lactatiformans]
MPDVSPFAFRRRAFCFGGGPDTHEQASKFYFGGFIHAQCFANTRKLTTLAMLAALAIVLVALIHFPLVPAALS